MKKLFEHLKKIFIKRKELLWLTSMLVLVFTLTFMVENIFASSDPVVWSNEGFTFTFTPDNNTLTVTGDETLTLSYSAFNVVNNDADFNKQQIKKIVLDGEYAIDPYCLFAVYKNNLAKYAVEIDLSKTHLDENKTLCSNMFNSCESLEKIYFGVNFDTSKIESYDSMFNNVTKLQNLNLSRSASVDSEANTFKMIIKNGGKSSDSIFLNTEFDVLNLQGVDFTGAKGLKDAFKGARIGVLDLRGCKFNQSSDNIKSFFAGFKADVIYLPDTFSCDETHLYGVYQAKKLNDTETLDDDEYYLDGGNKKEFIKLTPKLDGSYDYLVRYKDIEELFKLDKNDLVYYYEEGEGIDFNILKLSDYEISDLVDNYVDECFTFKKWGKSNISSAQYCDPMYEDGRCEKFRFSLESGIDGFVDYGGSFEWEITGTFDIKAGTYTFNSIADNVCINLSVENEDGDYLFDNWDDTCGPLIVEIPNDTKAWVCLQFIVYDDSLTPEQIIAGNDIYALPEGFSNFIPDLDFSTRVEDINDTKAGSTLHFDETLEPVTKIIPYMDGYGLNRNLQEEVIIVKNYNTHTNVESYDKGVFISSEVKNVRRGNTLIVPLVKSGDRKSATIKYWKWNDDEYRYVYQPSMKKQVDLNTTSQVVIDDIDDNYTITINYSDEDLNPPSPPGGGGGGGGGGGAATPKNYKVTIKDIDEKELDNFEVNDGRFTLPNDLKKAGYKFAGYFEDKNFKKEFTKDSKVTKNMTIYVKWEELSKWIPYIKGYDDGTFKPNNKLTRAEVATIIARLSDNFEEGENYGADSFEDTKENYWYSNYIKFVCDNKIFEGYPDGTFKPDRPITRGELAKVLVIHYNLKLSEDEEKNQKEFTDIKDVDFFKEQANILLTKGLIRGYEDGSFMGNNPVTRAEACTMINSIIKSFNVDSSIEDIESKFSDVRKSDWFYDDVLLASKIQ